MAELSEAAIAELKSKHGDRLIKVTAPSGDILVLKPPSLEIWGRFQDTVSRDKGSRAVAIRQVVGECVVYPPPPDAAALFAKLPAYPSSLLGELAEMAGQVEELNVVKL